MSGAILMIRTNMESKISVRKEKILHRLMEMHNNINFIKYSTESKHENVHLIKNNSYIYPMDGNNGAGVYIIQNLVTGRIYVGSTKNFDDRMKSHFKSLRKGNHYNKELQKDYSFFGDENFGCCVLIRLELTSDLENAEILIHDDLIEMGFVLYNKAKIQRDKSKD